MSKFLSLPDADPGPVVSNLLIRQKTFSGQFLKLLKKDPHEQATSLPHYYECIAVVHFIV